MKKNLFTLSALVVLSLNSNAQNDNASGNANSQWRITGNNASTSDFIGTTNNQSLIFKTNNVERALFDTQGRTIFDGGGEVIIHPGGLHRPIPSNPIAAYMLKVGGSGIFEGELNSRQLFVEEYITFMKSLKGPRIDVDTIRMDSTRGIYGHTKIFGDVNIKQNLLVEGNTILKGDLISEKGILFNPNEGIKQTIMSDGTKLYTYGRTIGNVIPKNPCAAGPQPWANHQFGGMLQIYNVDAVGNYIPNNGLLNFQTWAGGSSIDASIGGQVGQGGLLLNYFCGNHTFINTGWDIPNNKDGGTVYMGAKVDMQRSLKIGWTENGYIDLNTSIEINQNDDNANGVKVNTWNGSIKAFSIFNPDNRKNALEIYGDGRAYFGSHRINSTHPHSNSQFQFDGKIGCKELVVIDPTKWADFVFDKNYSLLPLNEVEAFYLVNKHLPCVPSEKEVKENGINTADMDAVLLQKIEELTLYIVQQQKEIEQLKKEIKKQ